MRQEKSVARFRLIPVWRRLAAEPHAQFAKCAEPTTSRRRTPPPLQRRGPIRTRHPPGRAQAQSSFRSSLAKRSRPPETRLRRGRPRILLKAGAENASSTRTSPTQYLQMVVQWIICFSRAEHYRTFQTKVNYVGSTCRCAERAGPDRRHRSAGRFVRVQRLPPHPLAPTSRSMSKRIVAPIVESTKRPVIPPVK